MDPVSSIGSLAVVLLLSAAFAAWRWAVATDRAERLSEALQEPLTGREAAARHLYGEAVGWKQQAMDDYDISPKVQEFWLREADILIASRQRQFHQ